MELTLDRPSMLNSKDSSSVPNTREVSSFSVSLVREPALRGALAAATRNMGDADVEELFQQYDTNSSGSIDAFELRNLLHTLGFEATASEVAQMLGQADLNRDSVIDLKEFRLLMGRDKPIH